LKALSEKLKVSLGGTSGPFGSRRMKTGWWGTEWPKVDLEKCTGCRLCEMYCPEPCIWIQDVDRKRKAVVDYDYCKGCGICSVVCPVGAITMEVKEMYKV